MSPQSKGAPHLGLRWHDAALVVMSVNSVTFAARSFRPRQGARCFRTGTRAYPTRNCKERATQPGPKRTAARRVAPNLASGFVAPRSQSAGGYAPSSRLAKSQMRRNKRGRIYETGYLAGKEVNS